MQGESGRPISGCWIKIVPAKQCCVQFYSFNNFLIMDDILFKLSSPYPVEIYRMIPFLSIKIFLGIAFLAPYRLLQVLSDPEHCFREFELIVEAAILPSRSPLPLHLVDIVVVVIQLYHVSLRWFCFRCACTTLSIRNWATLVWKAKERI